MFEACDGMGFSFKRGKFIRPKYNYSASGVWGLGFGVWGLGFGLNGVMNFSVLDGWWCEGYKPGAGWALSEHDTYADVHQQNELDAETIYNLLENDIVPTYYDQDKNGVSESWVQHIKNTIAQIAPEFVMGRMLDDYQSRFYGKLWDRNQGLIRDNYQAARALTAW
jgi:glucan phosphorylase